MKLYVTTFNWGGIKDKKDVFSRNLKCGELILTALIRDISLDTDIKDIFKLIQDETPSIEWQTENLFRSNNREIVTQIEFNRIDSYASHGYQSMNNDLRDIPSGKAILNDVIDKMPPLDKDIIVFRYIEMDNFLSH